MADLYSALPRELRDYIYEYVLTDPMGLSCRRGDDGVSRICASPSVDLRHAAITNGNTLCSLSSVYSALGAIFSLAFGKRQTESFNQIQYVNRAFRRGTSGLEFKYNSILFEDGGGRSAAQRCRIFVNEMEGRDYADDLRLCVISSHLPFQREFKNQAMTLLEFCAQHPKATIRLHDSQGPWTIQSSYRWVLPIPPFCEATETY